MGLILGCLAPLNAAADWTTITAASGTGGSTPRDTALVTNSDGYSLNVRRDSNGIVRGAFSLGDDARLLDERSCPTIRIDDQKPRALTELDGPCEVEGGTAKFALGTISDGVIRSTLLAQLMAGTRIFVWHHVKNHGYEETEFTLRGSMQALMEAMGKDVRVLPQ